MKLFHTNVILQDKAKDLKPAYSIGVDPVLTLEDAFKIIERFIKSDDVICCSAYIMEEDRDTKTRRIVYARNYVCIIGTYYPDVRNYEGIYFDIKEEMKRYGEEV